MLVVAGLGNPGDAYSGNRHNIGFMAADAVARRHSFSPWRNKFRSLACDGEIAGEKILILKPQTFMNLSGEAVGEALRFHKLDASRLLVLYDELDLAPGKLRVKTGGGSGGHNGIRSIDSHCGNAYRRVRLGIGHPGHKDLVQRHVLGDFAKADQPWLDRFIDAVAEHFPLLAAGDDSTFMNRVALAMGDEPQKPAKADGPAPRAQSHVRQARDRKPKPELPQTGPMADMLKKLFGKE